MTNAVEFKNESGLEFVDISSEEWREYSFPGGETVRILDPLQLYVSDNGHRIFDSAGVSHYVPFGWVHLCWRSKDGSAHFVK